MDKWNANSPLALYSESFSERILVRMANRRLRYPDVALDTSMNYLECTGQAEKFVTVQRVAATAIATGA